MVLEKPRAGHKGVCVRDGVRKVRVREEIRKMCVR